MCSVNGKIKIEDFISVFIETEVNKIQKEKYFQLENIFLFRNLNLNLKKDTINFRIQLDKSKIKDLYTRKERLNID